MEKESIPSCSSEVVEVTVTPGATSSLEINLQSAAVMVGWGEVGMVESYNG